LDCIGFLYPPHSYDKGRADRRKYEQRRKENRRGREKEKNEER
jgi:hypothetical protein